MGRGGVETKYKGINNRMDRFTFTKVPNGVFSTIAIIR